MPTRSLRSIHLIVILSILRFLAEASLPGLPRHKSRCRQAHRKPPPQQRPR